MSMKILAAAAAAALGVGTPLIAAPVAHAYCPPYVPAALCTAMPGNGSVPGVPSVPAAAPPVAAPPAAAPGLPLPAAIPPAPAAAIPQAPTPPLNAFPPAVGVPCATATCEVFGPPAPKAPTPTAGVPAIPSAPAAGPTQVGLTAPPPGVSCGSFGNCPALAPGQSYDNTGNIINVNPGVTAPPGYSLACASDLEPGSCILHPGLPPNPTTPSLQQGASTYNPGNPYVPTENLNAPSLAYPGMAPNALPWFPSCDPSLCGPAPIAAPAPLESVPITVAAPSPGAPAPGNAPVYGPIPNGVLPANPPGDAYAPNMPASGPFNSRSNGPTAGGCGGALLPPCENTPLPPAEQPSLAMARCSGGAIRSECGGPNGDSLALPPDYSAGHNFFTVAQPNGTCGQGFLMPPGVSNPLCTPPCQMALGNPSNPDVMLVNNPRLFKGQPCDMAGGYLAPGQASVAP